jgi:hypothetical protein
MKHFYPVRHPPVPPAATRGETTPPEPDACSTTDKPARAQPRERPPDKATPTAEPTRARK